MTTRRILRIVKVPWTVALASVMALPLAVVMSASGGTSFGGGTTGAGRPRG